MKWISVKDGLPKDLQKVLVSFLIEVLGMETPFTDKRLYAEGFFNPETGWSIENCYVRDSRYPSGFICDNLRITHWTPFLTPLEMTNVN